MASEGHVDLNSLLSSNWIAANTDGVTPTFSIAEQYNFHNIATERVISMSRGGPTRRKKDVTFSTVTMNYPVMVEVYTRTSEAHLNKMSVEVQRIIDSVRTGTTINSLAYSEIEITRTIPASYDKASIWREVIELEMRVFMRDV